MMWRDPFKAGGGAEILAAPIAQLTPAKMPAERKLQEFALETMADDLARMEYLRRRRRKFSRDYELSGSFYQEPQARRRKSPDPETLNAFLDRRSWGSAPLETMARKGAPPRGRRAEEREGTFSLQL